MGRWLREHDLADPEAVTDADLARARALRTALRAALRHDGEETQVLTGCSFDVSLAGRHGARLGQLAGYATCAPEFATWRGRTYLHLDCLYLRADHRGQGLGGLLFEAVVAEARALGVEEVQWNTPAWNTGAIRFYDRLGATGVEKMRYTLRMGSEAP
ncbi:GNAT family N-acetyltransferase [Nonomuraea sp. K274]|uniref:GNAT family N-acetyltransferase n=1 Tax=Nonomuraea cypriaca TaxID=1187855 RepID=A0A931A8E0_9ACTN|nr:GNAT family N-acetyltransferase [Nonomuraea cypriaca]